MCGRYIVVEDEEYYEEIKKIITEISEKHEGPTVAKGEIFPANTIPVVYSHNGRSILSSAKWGFPSFRNSNVIINARAETIAEKPMFRNSFAAKRCLEPANGYFEWLTHEDKKKTKYMIRVKEKRLFFMAGLYNMFTDKSGDSYVAITIATTEANPDISFIHDRMPAILQDKVIDTWLDDTNKDLSELQGLLVPYGAGEMGFAVA